MIARAAAWALLGLALLPSAASAHAYIVRTSPADTAVLRAAPAVARLRFSEPVELGPKSVQLLDARGKVIDTPAPAHAGADTAVLRLPGRLARGTHVVAWRVVSADSHPVAGAFSFSVGAPSAVVNTAPRGVNVVVGALDAVSRVVSFGGLALAIGGACLLLVLWPDGPHSRTGRRLLWAGIGALLGGTLLLLLLQGPYAAGDSVAGMFRPSLLSFSLGTRFGHALVVRLLLAAAFAGLVAAGLRGSLHRRALAGCAIGLVFTWTLADHSRTGVQTWLGVPAASVHLLAMALWLGGLTLLLFAVLRGGRSDFSLMVAVGRFSRLALACFVALGITGVYLSYRQSGELPALPATGFGRLLLIKSAVVLGIIGLAYFSRRAVQRGEPGSLRRTVGGEALLGVGVLGLTAALVNSAPARVSYAPPFDATVAAPAGAGAALRGGRIQVHIEPAKEGQNVADVFLVQRDGSLYPAPEIAARMVPPGGGVGPLKVELTAAEPGHYVADRLNVPFTGDWRLRLEIRTSDVDEADVEIPVRVR